MKEAFIDHIVQLTPYISIAAVAFIISLALTPLAIRIAPKIGAMDIPKDNRRMRKSDAQVRGNGYLRGDGNRTGRLLP